MANEIGNSVARNTSIMMGSQIITWISSFILLLFLPKYLGSQGYGQLCLGISVAMIMSIIIDFGGNYLIPKEIAKEKEKTPEILISYMGIRIVIWFLCLVVALLFFYLADYSKTILLVVSILCVSKLWEGIAKAIRSLFQGHEMMEYPSIGMIAEKIFISAFAVTALLLGKGVITIALIMAGGIAIKLLINTSLLPKIVDVFPKFEIKGSIDLIKSSIPYFLWSVFAVIYYRIDAVMLSIMQGEQVVGWYGGAYRFFDIAMFFPSIITTVIFPIFSKLSSKKSHKFKETFQTSLRYMLLVGIPIMIVFLFYARDLVKVFYGLNGYEPSILILQVFAPGVLLVYTDFILGSSILAGNNQKTLAKVGFAAIFLNLILNYFLIGFAQSLVGNAGVGAAVSTIITELFILVSAVKILPNYYFKNISFDLFLKSTLAGFVFTVLVFVFQTTAIYWLIQILVSLGLYFYFAVKTGFVEEHEVEFIKQFLRRNASKFLITQSK